MGEMSNTIGDTVAWARDGASHELKRAMEQIDFAMAALAQRIVDLEERVTHLENGTKP